jgi:hypothetical protein
MHGGVALEKHPSLSSLDTAPSGWATEGSRVRIKHALDAAPTLATN